MSVELTLNLAWAVLSTLGLMFWLRAARPDGASKSTQLLTLKLLALVLFPVISVTDDFLAAQMPTETDTIIRRDFQAHQRTVAPEIAIVPQVNAAIPLAFLGHVPAGEEPVSAPQIHDLYVYFIRPPPAA